MNEAVDYHNCFANGPDRVLYRDAHNVVESPPTNHQERLSPCFLVQATDVCRDDRRVIVKRICYSWAYSQVHPRISDVRGNVVKRTPGWFEEEGSVHLVHIG